MFLWLKLSLNCDLILQTDKKDIGKESKYIELEKTGSAHDEELPRIKDRPTCVFLQGAESLVTY